MLVLHDVVNDQETGLVAYVDRHLLKVLPRLAVTYFQTQEHVIAGEIYESMVGS